MAYAHQGSARAALRFNRCEVNEHDFTLDKGLEIGCLPHAKCGISYTLADVDPTRISVHGGTLEFATTNDKRSIEYQSGTLYSQWFVVFDSEEHATRFAKAFKLAVALCGGKASAF